MSEPRITAENPATLNEAFQAGYAAARADVEGLLIVCRDFIREWEATWTDPDDINHEWREIYVAAKAALTAWEARP